MPRTSNRTVRSYRDLLVWQKSVDLVVTCYQFTKCLPPDERFEMARQVRRAATSIPANIAEGHGREHLGDYIRHLSISNGSLMELETHVIVANRLEYCTAAVAQNLLEPMAEVGRMLAGLIRSLKARHH